MIRRFGGAEPGVRYVVGSLVLGVFIGGLGGGIVFPTLPTLGPVLGISPLMVGVILSANRFSRLVLNTPAGHVLDTIGTHKPMISGFLIQGIIPFGYIIGLDPGPVPLDNATIFLLLRIFWGVGSAVIFVGAFTMITHITTPKNRGRWMGYMRGGQSLGVPTGFVIGGFVADTFGYAEAFAVAGFAGLTAAVVAALVLPDVNPDVETSSKLSEIPSIVRADRRILAVNTINFVVRFIFAGILISTVVLYTQTYDISVSFLSGLGTGSIIMAISLLAVSFTTMAVGGYSDSLTNRAVLTLPALALLAGGFLTLILFPGFMSSLIGVVLIGVGVGGTNPPLLAFLGDISPEEDVGKLGGVYNVFGDIGGTLGPLVGLPLATEWGFTIGYGACALLVGVAGLIAFHALYGSQVSSTYS